MYDLLTLWTVMQVCIAWHPTHSELQYVGDYQIFVYLFRIQSSTFDGDDVRTLGSAGQRISHPFGLALYHGTDSLLQLSPDSTCSVLPWIIVQFVVGLAVSFRTRCGLVVDLLCSEDLLWIVVDLLLFSSLFSSLRGRQPSNCLALRPPIGPNALPLINQLVIEISGWFLQTSRE